MTNFTPTETMQLLDLVRGLARELRPGANGIERLDLDHELERDFGLDSLARVEQLARIERELGVRLAEWRLPRPKPRATCCARWA